MAWLGGAAFVGSLGYFLYFYVVVLGVAAPAAAVPPWRALLVDVTLFAIFAIHHSVMARVGVKAWLTRHVPPALERSLYVWVASTLFFAVCWFWQRLPGRLYQAAGWPALPFRAVQMAGLLLVAVSARALDVFDLAGIRQTAHGPAAHARATEPGRLETDGPYRLVRHPIYLGTLLLMASTPAMTAGRLTFTLLSLAYLMIGVVFEERSLRAEFGAVYAAYEAKVKWRIVPGVY
jgi:protein-S-isoprenylcysteine O-methyltransferase Ste14